MTYGNFEMQMEDDIAHEDGIALAAGNLCGLCGGSMHETADCNRNVPCIGCDGIGIFLNSDQRCDFCHDKFQKDQDAYWTQQEAQKVNWLMGDFTCSHCNKDFIRPHEGLFFGNSEPDVLCIDCSLKENNVI